MFGLDKSSEWGTLARSVTTFFLSMIRTMLLMPDWALKGYWFPVGPAWLGGQLSIMVQISPVSACTLTCLIWDSGRAGARPRAAFTSVTKDC